MQSKTQALTYFIIWSRCSHTESFLLSSQVQSRVSTGRDVPGQTGTGRPVVPLSRDKKKILVPVSLCPGTRAGANVPGQNSLSRDVPGQNWLKKFLNKTTFHVLEHHIPVLEHHFPVLEHHFPASEHLFCFRTSFFCSVPFCPVSRPGFWLSRPVPALDKIFSLSRCPFVQKSCTVPSCWKPYSKYESGQFERNLLQNSQCASVTLIVWLLTTD